MASSKRIREFETDSTFFDFISTGDNSKTQRYHIRIGTSYSAYIFTLDS